jgi:hypothetical protein
MNCLRMSSILISRVVWIFGEEQLGLENQNGFVLEKGFNNSKLLTVLFTSSVPVTKYKNNSQQREIILVHIFTDFTPFSLILLILGLGWSKISWQLR